MEYQQLGSSSLRISKIGFGCMSLGSDSDQATRILHHAFELGINYFDTADLYDKGSNEQIVGIALKEKRKEIILATKVGNQWRSDGSGWDWNPRKQYILQAVEKSLQRLQTDYIDLYQLHGGTLEDPIDETIEAFELLQQQGKIRFYGISSIRPAVIREWIQRSLMVSVMMQYSLLDRRAEEECLSLLQQHGVGVLARGTLAKGLLVDKPASPYLHHSIQEVASAAMGIKRLASDKKSASHVALQFALHHPAITSAVVGCSSLQQLQDIGTIFDNPALTDEETQALTSLTKRGNYT